MAIIIAIKRDLNHLVSELTPELRLGGPIIRIPVIKKKGII
jgi:hypothetical protein